MIISDTTEVEAQDKELLSDNKHDPAEIVTQQNQDEGHIALLIDKQDSTSATTENLERAPTSMSPDNCDSAPMTTSQGRSDADVSASLIICQ